MIATKERSQLRNSLRYYILLRLVRYCGLGRVKLLAKEGRGQVCCIIAEWLTPLCRIITASPRTQENYSIREITPVLEYKKNVLGLCNCLS